MRPWHQVGDAAVLMAVGDADDDVPKGGVGDVPPKFQAIRSWKIPGLGLMLAGVPENHL